MPWPGVVEWRGTEHPLYAVSSDGVVVSFAKKEPRAIKQSLRRDGYMVVDLTMSCRGRAVHRLVARAFGVDCTEQIDHINRDKTDNRIENLRAASACENRINTKDRVRIHKYRGINRKGSRYRAQISYRGVHHHLGSFSTVEDAAEAYNKAALTIHGQFAVLNKVTP